MNKGILFVSKTCPTCGPLKTEMFNNYNNIELVDISENITKAKEYMIRSIPCLVILDENNEELSRAIRTSLAIKELSNIYL